MYVQTKTPFIAPHVRLTSTLGRDYQDDYGLNDHLNEGTREPNTALTQREKAREKRRRRFWFGR